MFKRRIQSLVNYSKYVSYFLFKTRCPVIPSFKRNKSDKARRIYNRVIYVSDGSVIQGGLTDRLYGLLTTFYEAKRQNKAFYIFWISPFNLIKYLEPNKYDWRINKEDIYFEYDYSSPVIIHWAKHDIENLIKKYIFKYHIAGSKDKLSYSNLNYAKKYYYELFNELFKPSEYLAGLLNYYLNLLGNNFYSYSFRFGNLFSDFNDYTGNADLNNKEKEELLSAVIKELDIFLKQLPPGYKAFIASDSSYFLNALKNLDSRIFFIEGSISHPDFSNSEIDNDKCWSKTFLDFFIISKAKKSYQLKTGLMYKSNFPEFASLIGQHEYIYHEF